MKKTAAIAFGGLLVALLACKGKAKGNLVVDGVAFEVKQCRSGQANVPKFNGVDFLDASKRRIRFLVLSNGKLRSFIFAPGARKGILIGDGCGSMRVERTNTKINNVYNIEGNVTANCTGSGHTIVANMDFKGCH